MSHIYHNRTGESVLYGVESFKTLYAGELACLCREIQASQLDVFRWRRKQECFWSGSSGPVLGERQQTKTSHQRAAFVQYGAFHLLLRARSRESGGLKAGREERSDNVSLPSQAEEGRKKAN